MTSRNRLADAGFTLIETLVVLAVLGLLLGLVASTMPARGRQLDVRAAAGDILSTLRLGRSRAIAGNRIVQVSFDTATPAITLDGTTRPLPPGMTLAVTTRASMVAEGRASIAFAPDGSASGGLVTVGDGRRAMRVAIDWLSGRVELADVP